MGIVLILTIIWIWMMVNCEEGLQMNLIMGVGLFVMSIFVTIIFR